MRTLTDTLKAAQEAYSIDALVKLELTKGGSSYTYTNTRILSIKETEDGSLQSLEIVLNNSDGELTDIDLKGFEGVLSNGAKTRAGDEYSACAPMWVIAQEFDSDPNKLTCTLSMIGIANLMQMDEAGDNCMPQLEKEGTATSTIANHLIDTGNSHFKASDVGRVVHNTTDDTYANVTEYNSQSNLTLDADIMADGEDYEIWTEGSNDTVKTLVNAIIGATLSAFNLCKAYEVVWEDGYDTLADNYRPKDAFRIYTKNNRWSAINRLLDYTLNVAVVKNDGKIHIFKPTTSGTTYDYEYSLESGHPFFAKALRNRIVIPGYIKVQSQDEDDPQYSGTAKDDGYDSLPAELKKQQYKKTYLESDEHATAIAEAILAKAQMWCEAGAADVPMNVGAEVFDYVKVTDSRESDYRIGNIGKLVRYYDVRKNEWRMTFTFGNWQNIRKVLANLNITADDFENYFSRLMVKDLYAENIIAENLDFVWIDPEGNIDLDKIGDTIDNLADGEYYARQQRLHLDASGVYIEEDTLYTLRTPDQGDNYLTKSTSAPTDPTTGDIWIDTNYTPNKVKMWSGSSWDEVSSSVLADLEKGVVILRTKRAALTANGLIVLDEVQVGTYGLVKYTDIQAGHILLSKTVKDGLWYEETGVVLDATYGIALYGGEGINAFRTFASKDDYDAGTPVQVYIGTDGKLYAGDGAVKIDNIGIGLWGSVLRFYHDSTQAGRIDVSPISPYEFGMLAMDGNPLLLATVGSPGGDIWLDPDSNYVLPYNNNVTRLGSTSKQFYGVYVKSRLKIPVGTDMYD